jgi:nucleoside-diphosphate-sugar epimerase
VQATVRDKAHAQQLQSLGIDAVVNDNPGELSAAWLQDCDAVLDSIPLSYDAAKQPVQSQSIWLTNLLNHMPNLQWAGYLSATSVYANSDGAWIDETSTHFSTSPRGVQRLQAESAWLQSTAPAEVFRLAGIYGNERNILSKLMAGNYKTVAWQPAHYSNRIHVDDIVAALMAAMGKPQAGRILNLADDAPCSHKDYVCQLAAIIGAPEPIVLTPEQAEKEMSPAYLDFFRDNKRISNHELHRDLLPSLKYPSFRDAVSNLKG